MRKLLILVAALVISMNFSACGNEKPVENKISVVTTIFPAYDWAKNIIGDENGFDLTLIGGSGVDLHSFQPSANDIAQISACDVLICVGGDSDSWIFDAIKHSTNKNLVVIKLIDVLGDKIKLEDVHEHENHDENHHHDGEIDEHVWLSLKNAQILCENIAKTLSKVDSSHENALQTNFNAYKAKISALEGEYQAAIAASPVKTLVFGDRFPFKYLCDDYNLQHFATFSGCSAETEASFATIKALADKIDELNLHFVLKIDGSTHKIAETVISNTKNKSQTILTLDSMQSASKNANYLDIMSKNLEILREALSK